MRNRLLLAVSLSICLVALCGTAKADATSSQTTSNAELQLAAVEADIAYATEYNWYLEDLYTATILYGGDSSEINAIRQELARVRAMLGLLRTEESFWRQEIQAEKERKKQLTDLAKA